MKLTANQRGLYQAFSYVENFRATSRTMPILKGIYMKNNILKATDLEVGIKYKTIIGVQEKGSIVFPAEIVRIIKELPNDEVQIKINENNFKAKITCQNSKFNLNCYNPGEFPELPEVGDYNNMYIQSGVLSKCLSKSLISVSKEETKPALEGILFTGKKMVSTNTYRMSVVNTLINDECEILIPGETANQLRKITKNIDEDIKISFGSNNIKFEMGDMVITSRLIEGEFPNWKQVMPDRKTNYITADKNELLNNVKRAYLIAKEDTGAINLQFSENKLVIEADNDNGHAHEELQVENNGIEEEINIDGSYLIEGLKVIDEDEVNIEIESEIRPLVLRQDDFTYLIMPVRPDSQG